MECIICLENLKYHVAILSCGHAYHIDCITEWIKKSKTLTNICPLCNEFKKVEIINILDNYQKPITITNLNDENTDNIGNRTNSTDNLIDTPIDTPIENNKCCVIL